MGWSAENATQAYFRTLKKVGDDTHRSIEPDTAEFISALAGGRNAQLMVEICGGAAGSATTFALLAAAQQTSGRVVCVVRNADDIGSSEMAMGSQVEALELVAGDACSLLMDQYVGADFVVIDCSEKNHQQVFHAAQAATRRHGGLIVGHNAFGARVSWASNAKTDLLPIGDGLLLTRVPASSAVTNNSSTSKSSRWIVRVDRRTGEEHVFRVNYPTKDQP